VLTARWRQEYNTLSPHRAVNYMFNINDRNYTSFRCVLEAR